MTYRIALLDDYQRIAAGLADWGSLAPAAVTISFSDHLSDIDELAERLADFDAIVTVRERTPFDAALLSRLPRLQLITTMGSANVAIDLAASARLGVSVAAAGVQSSPLAMASFTWSLILALTRRIPPEAHAVRTGGWQRRLGVELEGKSLGLLGLGRIGSAVAKLGTAFGMRPIAWSEHLTADRAGEAGAVLVDLDTLLAEADILSIHLRLSHRTRGLIDRSRLGAIKRSAFLINTARGAIVDESALVEVLRDGGLAGAAIDSFEIEPLPLRHPFRSLHNVLATPHIGFVTEEAYRRAYPAMFEAVRSFVRGEPIPGLLTSSQAQ